MKSLTTFYARLDALPMSRAERDLAKARLAQGDALGEFLVAAIALIQRLGSPQPRPAHSRA